MRRKASLQAAFGTPSDAELGNGRRSYAAKLSPHNKVMPNRPSTPDIGAHWVSVRLRPTHGTATPAICPSVLPKDKRACEVFWASALLSRLTELQPFNPKVTSCEDDSHGNHDVIAGLNDGGSIGIQVTELTYELERARSSQRDRFIGDVLRCFESRALSSTRQLLVQIFVPFSPGVRFSVPPPNVLADATTSFINESPEQKTVKLGSARVFFQWVDTGAFYVPSVAGIGIDCDIDALPRSVNMYRDAVSCLRDKKAASSSPWLLVWSTSFWRDKHWLEEEVLRHMRNSFENSPFDRVFFMETMDGPGYFEANLAIHAIKA